MPRSSFHERVSRAIKRGNNFDVDIPEYAADAVKSLERLHSWKHMWVEEEVVLAATVTSRTITNLKNCRWIKKINSDGIAIPLKKISPIQILQRRTDSFPGGYWLSSQTKIEFDASHPTLGITLRYGYYKFSNYDDNCPWFDLDENLLLAQTMLEMAPLLKDDKINSAYAPIVEAKAQILKDAQSEAEFDGQDQSMIPYADDMEVFLDSDVDWGV